VNIRFAEEIKTAMKYYLNAEWKNVITPENVTYQGHSQDGRTYRKSYAYNPPNSITHVGFTTSNAETMQDEKICSHFKKE
jgi:hypothetical protein